MKRKRTYTDEQRKRKNVYNRKLYNAIKDTEEYKEHKRQYYKNRAPFTSEYDKARRQNIYYKNKTAWFAGKVCVDCGGTKELEADHIDPALKVSNDVWRWGKARREAELAKCAVRCRLCHRKRTSEQRRRPITHGKYTSYNSRGCRCDKCCAARREHYRQNADKINATRRKYVARNKDRINAVRRATNLRKKQLKQLKKAA